MSPLNRGSYLLVRFPGVPPLCGYTAGLPYIAPRRGSDFGGHSPAGYPLQITIYRVFRDAQIALTFKPWNPVKLRAPEMSQYDTSYQNE